MPGLFLPGGETFFEIKQLSITPIFNGWNMHGWKTIMCYQPKHMARGNFFEIRHLSITPNFPQCQTISPQKSIITLIQFQRAFTSEYMQGRKTYTQPTSQYPGRGRSLLVAKNQTIIHHSNWVSTFNLLVAKIKQLSTNSIEFQPSTFKLQTSTFCWPKSNNYPPPVQLSFNGWKTEWPHPSWFGSIRLQRFTE